MLTFAESLVPFDLTLSTIGTIRSEEGVVYLAPVVTKQFLNGNEAS